MSFSTLWIQHHFNDSNSSSDTEPHSSSTKPVTYQNAILFSESYSDNHQVIELQVSNNFTDMITSSALTSS